MGLNNVAIGAYTLQNDWGGSNNVAIGAYAFYDLNPITGAILSIDDYSATVAGTIRVYAPSHGRSTNDVVEIFGSLYYDGTYTITRIDNNYFYIGKQFIRTENYGSSSSTSWIRWRLTTALGSNNVAIGQNTGRGITYGSGNTIIGGNITGLTGSLTNNIILGSGSVIRLQFDGTKWLVGYNVVMTGSADAIQFVIKGYSSQALNLQEWQDSSANVLAYVDKKGLIKSSGRKSALVTKTDNYIVTTNDEIIICNKATAMTITLLAATGSGQTYHIKNIGAGVVTIDANGTELIDGAETKTINQWEFITVVDGASGNWYII